MEIDLQIEQTTTYLVSPNSYGAGIVPKYELKSCDFFSRGYQSALVCDKMCSLRTTISMPLH